MLHLNRLFLLQTVPPIWAEICLWFCASCSSVVWRLNPNLLSGRLFAWPSYWRLLRSGVDITQCFTELVTASHLGLRAPGVAIDHYPPLSSLSLKRLVMMASGFLTVWLLRIRIPGKRRIACGGPNRGLLGPKTFTKLLILVSLIWWNEFF